VNEALRRVTIAAIKKRGSITECAASINMKQSTFSRKLHSDAFFSVEQFMGICAYAGVTADELYKRSMESGAA
jgi:hypothetical protein